MWGFPGKTMVSSTSHYATLLQTRSYHVSLWCHSHIVLNYLIDDDYPDCSQPDYSHFKRAPYQKLAIFKKFIRYFQKAYKLLRNKNSKMVLIRTSLHQTRQGLCELCCLVRKDYLNCFWLSQSKPLLWIMTRIPKEERLIGTL